MRFSLFVWCQFLARSPVVSLAGSVAHAFHVDLFGLARRIEHLEHDPRIVRPLQDLGNYPRLLGLERSDGNFEDLLVLDALGASTPVGGTADLHVCSEPGRANFVERLIGRYVR